MTFVLDENISPRLAQILDIFDQQNEIRHLTHVDQRGAADVEWIGRLAKWQPVPAVVCGDGRILRNAAEAAALREAGLTFVILSPSWMKTPFYDQAWKLLKAWPIVVKSVSHAVNPTVFELPISGSKLRRTPWT